MGKLNDKDAQKIREQLEIRLRARVPHVVWNRLVKNGYVRDVYTGGDEDSWRELENEAREELEVYHDGASNGGTPPGRGSERAAPEEITVECYEHTRKRGQTLSEITAYLAEQRPDVLRFRRRYLRNRLLSNEEASAFLQGEGEGQRKLKRLAGTLSRFYGCRERDAARFLLTSEPPGRKPVRVAVASVESNRPYVPSARRITIEADAWVDAEEITRAYKTAQRQVIGGDNRKPKAKTLEVVNFVLRQTEEHRARPSWPVLLDRWNQKHPEWRYQDYCEFRRLFDRFMRRTMNPMYRQPKWKH